MRAEDILLSVSVQVRCPLRGWLSYYAVGVEPQLWHFGKLNDWYDGWLEIERQQVFQLIRDAAQKDPSIMDRFR